MCSTIRNMLREGLKLRVTERTTEEFFEFNANFEGTACSKLYENEASASPRRLRITQVYVARPYTHKHNRTRERTHGTYPSKRFRFVERCIAELNRGENVDHLGMKI
ncbi:hypothetical protein V1477_007440 [Vespula maculifrons]|uniref:Uncharacterized protein n=1 Tax=Vespula maculifrons TaxID=7453 RepID=A0ABD2CIH1_VESMC